MPKVPFPMFPERSWAEQKTVLLPIGKTEKESRLHTGVSTPSTSSRAVTLNHTMAPNSSSPYTVMLEGTVTTGGITSA